MPDSDSDDEAHRVSPKATSKKTEVQKESEKDNGKAAAGMKATEGRTPKETSASPVEASKSEQEVNKSEDSGEQKEELKKKTVLKKKKKRPKGRPTIKKQATIDTTAANQVKM